MKQFILDCSQRFGKYTNDISIGLLSNGYINWAHIMNLINDQQMRLHSYLMKVFNTGKCLKL
jgi:hypothetical protein